jgi:hypothetical protein
LILIIACQKWESCPNVLAIPEDSQAGTGPANPASRRPMMRLFRQQHEFYFGVDLHTITQGETMKAWDLFVFSKANHP